MKARGLTGLCLSAIAAVAAACTSTGPNPLESYEQVQPSPTLQAPAADANNYPREQVAQGRYLVSLLGCGTCHTNGALIGEPKWEQLLAGSDVGIAYTNPLENKNPGVLYPANLTPDMETGIGSWSDEQIVGMLRMGIDKHGRSSLSVMPWPAYSRLKESDAEAIAAYLRSLKPVRHKVPNNVEPGQGARAPYVHLGIYRSRR